MSWPHQDAVWRLRLSPTRKLTLLALADQAAAATGEVAMSRSRIARMTGLSISTVKRETLALIASGHLEAVTSATKVESYRYRLMVVRGVMVTSGQGDQRSQRSAGSGQGEPHLIPITDPLKALKASAGDTTRKERPTNAQLQKLVHVIIDDHTTQLEDAGDLVDRLKRSCVAADFLYDPDQVHKAVDHALAARGVKPWLPLKGQRLRR